VRFQEASLPTNVLGEPGKPTYLGADPTVDANPPQMPFVPAFVMTPSKIVLQTVSAHAKAEILIAVGDRQ